MSPYREPPPTPPLRWWQRLACAFGRHRWSAVETRVDMEIHRPCECCPAVLAWVPACPQLGEFIVGSERDPNATPPFA